ncbi:phospholipid-binding protein [Dictyostelium discoideum AX4]|uniref:Copine-F n=1 Tax=Dictyostelium discoideum TaxID=44689 RepID=CPNF_DICDI|nr:phospholipid-binding protein [Dictyostelium discoideum AX4]Q1ZXB3.1 RecName: Full=Copine-F [Dictyostelium discoideum]EAS66821.1 phospholipid-binding protein [Dictyostelium discoideum AX4]|eukprot:XP_001134504.1 phospholipid-binding protein [Dictyostelium discoideum AX4]
MAETIRPISKIELRFKLADIKKPSSQIIVYCNSGDSKRFDLIGATERIDNKSEPFFNTTINIDYYFESVQKLYLLAINHNLKTLDFTKIDQLDVVGEFTPTIGDLISRDGKRLIGDIKDKDKITGKIEITAEEIYETGHNIILQLKGTKLDKKDLFSSDPYFKIYKSSPSGNSIVFESSVIKNNINPIFDPIVIRLQELNGGCMFRELTFEFWDHNDIVDDELIGSFRTNTDEILSGIIKEFPIINQKLKSKKSNYEHSGIINFIDSRILYKPTIQDFINGNGNGNGNGDGNCLIDLMVAIDCTESNGDQKLETSLHYNVKPHQNQYIRSLLALESQLLNNFGVKLEKRVEVFGFGAVINKHPNHNFRFHYIIDDRPNTLKAGISGVIELYDKAIPKIQFTSPTKISSIIEDATRYSLQDFHSTQLKYSILLILIDSDITDYESTVDEIVEASKAPLSIIFIGVGEYSFQNIPQLDGEKNGNIRLIGRFDRKQIRDNVHFISFKEFSINQIDFQNEILRKLPNQLTEFMEFKNYLPNGLSYTQTEIKKIK